MKGFGIEIKNNLLDPKHVKSMGQSVWLYMFLVDKITRIDAQGRGIVLGGKPIKFSDVEEEIGVSKYTYTRWISQLKKYPYIEAIHTPYGISFRVLKAFKRFRTNAELGSAQMRNHRSEKAEPNKTLTVDINSKTVANAKNDMKEYKEYEHQEDGLPSMDYDTQEITSESNSSVKKNTSEMLEVYKIFSDNPAHSEWFKQKPQRDAASSLLKRASVDDIRSNYALVKKHRENEFCPSIHSPYDMNNKEVKMLEFLKKI